MTEQRKAPFCKLSEIVAGAPDEILPDAKENLPDLLFDPCDKAYRISTIARENPKFKEELIKTLSGKTLADIGAGGVFWGGDTGFNLAQKYGSTAYIGIEPCEEIARDLEFGINHFYDPKSRLSKIHISKTDMRKFMREMPSDCRDLSILMSGIDGFILGAYYLQDARDPKKTDRYLQDYFRELARVLPSRGRIIVHESYLPQEELFTPVCSAKHTGDITYIFERKDK